MKRDLKMYAEIGDTVQYFPGGDVSQEPWCAFVTRLGNGTALTLNTVSPDLRNMDIQDGVRCIADKTAKSIEIAEHGGWRPRPLDVMLRKLLIDGGVLVWNDEDRLVPKDEYVPKKKVEQPAKKTTAAPVAQSA